MTASSKIKTPTMKIPFLETIDGEAQAAFCKQYTRLTLSQIVDEVVITQTLSSKGEETDFARRKLYKVKLVFYPRWQYSDEYATTPDEVFAGISRNFVGTLDKEILKELKILAKESKQTVVDVGKGKSTASSAPTTTTGTEEDAPEDAGEAGGAPAIGPDDDADDGDADDAKRAAKQKQSTSYDEDDEEVLAAQAPTELDEAAFDAEFDDPPTDDDADMRVDPDETEAQRVKREARLETMRDLEDAAIANSRYIDKLTFDKADGQWAELSLEVRPTPAPYFTPCEPILSVCRYRAQAPARGYCGASMPQRRHPSSSRHRSLSRHSAAEPGPDRTSGLGIQRSGLSMPADLLYDRRRQPGGCMAIWPRRPRSGSHHVQRHCCHSTHLRCRGGAIDHHPRDVWRVWRVRHRRRQAPPVPHCRLHGARRPYTSMLTIAYTRTDWRGWLSALQPDWPLVVQLTLPQGFVRDDLAGPSSHLEAVLALTSG
jgi:hypothetical protein